MKEDEGFKEFKRVFIRMASMFIDQLFVASTPRACKDDGLLNIKITRGIQMPFAAESRMSLE